MKSCIIKSHLSSVQMQMGTYSAGINRKTVGEQLHFSKRVIAALPNKGSNSFPILANEYGGCDSLTVPLHPAFSLHLWARGSCKGEKRRVFNNEALECPQSKNGLNLRSWLTVMLRLEQASSGTLTHCLITHSATASTYLMHHTSNSTLWCLKDKLQLGVADELMTKYCAMTFNY